MKIKFLFIYLLPPLLISCQTGWHGEERDFRGDMRNFVQEISSYSRSADPGFIIIPQNGHQLLTADGLSSGTEEADYITAIDGIGREDLFYGYINDDAATPAEENTEMLGFMNLAESNNVEVLTTDYCSTPDKIDDSYSQNNTRSYISFAADSRNLDTIPDYPSAPYNVNSADATNLSEAANFLYLLDPSGFSSKSGYLNAVDETDYDLLIIDLFYEDNEGNTEALSSSDLAELKTKNNGSRRLLICYMSIGEAEDYRYYWNSSWKAGSPEWLAAENPDWAGNYKVEYWNDEWKQIIFGNSEAYLDKIIAAGFDGVYLDIIDAYEFFEDSLGL